MAEHRARGTLSRAGSLAGRLDAVTLIRVNRAESRWSPYCTVRLRGLARPCLSIHSLLARRVDIGRLTGLHRWRLVCLVAGYLLAVPEGLLAVPEGLVAIWLGCCPRIFLR